MIGAIPSTASSTPSTRVFGYEKLMVCDGAAIPANAGVNPSLTITAVAEHAAGCPAAQPRDNLASEDPPA